MTNGATSSKMRFLRPEVIVRQLPVAQGSTVADFGAGMGHFSVLLGERVGSRGRVYAIDVLAEAIEAIRSRARLSGVINIEAIRADLERPGSTGLPDASVDLVLIANVLFQSQKKEAILREAFRILRREGRLTLIDWKKGDAFAPRAGIFPLSKEEAKELAQKIGFVFEGELEVGMHHFGMMFKK